MKNLRQEICGASAANAKALVGLLHGFGATAMDILSLGHAWADALPSVRFIALEAPDAVLGIPHGFQWFALHDMNKSRILSEIEQLTPALKGSIDDNLQKCDLGWENVVLCGFSQGGALALTQGLQHLPCAGVLSYSGMLALGTSPINTKPVCLVHGDADDVVDPLHFEEAQRFLKAKGVSFEAHLDKGAAHTITPFAVSKGAQFLKRTFEL